MNHNLRTDITKRVLYNLYVRQRLSSPVIARRLKCDPTTVRNHLRREGLLIRSYKEAFRHRTHSKFPGRITYPKRDFDGDAAAKAYLIGFRLGDLTATPVNPGQYSQTIAVHCRTTRIEQAELFKSLFSRYGHVYHAKPNPDGTIASTAYLNRSFDFLLRKTDSVEDWVSADERCSAAFAAGYIDAEGSFHIVRSSGLGKAVFALASQDKCILQWFYEWFQRIGVQCCAPKVAIRRNTLREFSLNKDYWILQVHRKDSLLTLASRLTPWLRHSKRRADLQRVLQNIKERNASPDLKFTSLTHRLQVSQLSN